MHFRKNERLAVFIDGANLSSTVSAVDLVIDFQGISRFFREKCNLVRIYSYAALPNERASIRHCSSGSSIITSASSPSRGAAPTGREELPTKGILDCSTWGRVNVISTKTPHLVVVDEDLRRKADHFQADHFIDPSDLKPYFERRKKSALAHA